MVDVSSITLLEKTDFLFPSMHQLQIVFWLVTEICVYFPSPYWNLVWIEFVTSFGYCHTHYETISSILTELSYTSQTSLGRKVVSHSRHHLSVMMISHQHGQRPIYSGQCLN